MLEPSARNLWASVTGIPGLTGTDIPIYKGVNDGIPNAAGQPLMFSQDGKSLVPVTWNYLTKTGYNASGGNGLATRDYNQLYAPSSQLNLTTLGHYDFTDHLHATWQAGTPVAAPVVRSGRGHGQHPILVTALWTWTAI